MRQSRLLLTTLRESPAEAEAASHRLLLRAGFIRQVAAGIYTYMPLGRRVLRKLEQIVREEMDRVGAQELLMPAMQPAELWKASGRYDVYGPELIRLHDRHEREFALGPTHEEVVTALAGNEIASYRKLPVTLYQIQTKFRDERRPRYGLLRGREFLMKDAYSFDADVEGLERSYRTMYEAYHRIFARCGLRFRAVEADGGAIGGEGGTHEFMALADIGEDTIAVCTCCSYAANVEKVLIDRTAANTPEAAAGADESVGHYRRGQLIEDAALDHVGDLSHVVEGDPCPRCGEGKLQFTRGIEIGQVFKLGTKYSDKLGAAFLDSSGASQSMVMGCYGIGISRMLSAVVEQHHDDLGIVWPSAVAPYDVHIIPVSASDSSQMQAAQEVYDRLLAQGAEALLDDREERPGVKFKDADLIGIPIRIVIGKDAAQGRVEWIERGSRKREIVPLDEALERLAASFRSSAGCTE